jgi:hypothetical protein
MKTKNMMNQWTCRFALAGVSLMGLSAFAADVTGLDSDVTPSAPEAADASGRMPVTVAVGGAEQFKSEIDNNNGGSFTITRFNASVRMPLKLNDEFRLGTTVRYGLDYYDWKDIPVNDTQWKYINTLQAASILSWSPKDSDFSYFGGGFVKMSAESGISLNRAATGGGIAGVNYKVSDTLTIGGGVAVTTVLEEKAAILPLLLAKWQFAQDWRLDLGFTDVATSGYGLDVKWLPSKEWELGVGAQVHKNNFRINGNVNDQLGNSTSNSKNGIATEQAATIYLDSTWHATDKFDLGAFAGVATGGKLKLADSSGDREQKVDYKAAAVIGLKAALRF